MHTQLDLIYPLFEYNNFHSNSTKAYTNKRNEKYNENFYLKEDLGRHYFIESIQIDRDQIQQLRV